MVDRMTKNTLEKENVELRCRITRHVFRKGSVRDYPLEIRHRDGHPTSVLYHATVYRVAGNVAGVFASARIGVERVARRSDGDRGKLS
jgi:hypothetical protein